MKHIDIALSQVGQQENPKGSNWGHPVQDYLASVGIHFAASWCMAFVYWCFAKSYGTVINDVPVLPPGFPLIKSAGVLDEYHRIDSKYKVSAPSPGDIFIMDHGNGQGHTGLVKVVQGDKIFTIEGNTNDTGSREGFEVMEKVRPIASCIGFIRIPTQTT